MISLNPSRRGRRGSVPSRHGHARGRDRVACGHAPRKPCLRSLTAREVLDCETGGINQACSGDPSREDDVQRARGTARLRISAVLMRGSGRAEDRPRPAGACQVRLESSRRVQRPPVCLSRDERALRFVRRALVPSDKTGPIPGPTVHQSDPRRACLSRKAPEHYFVFKMRSASQSHARQVRLLRPSALSPLTTPLFWGMRTTAPKAILHHVRVTAAMVMVAVGLALTVSVALAAPTKTQFIRRGDALCGQVQRDLAPLRRRAEAAKSLPEAQKWAAVTALWSDQIRIQARFITRFRAIGVPAGDATARSLSSGLDRGLLLARRVRAAFAARSTTAVSAGLPAYVRFTLSLNRRVRAYGFRVCGG
jgi:hypothetical protein